MAGLCLFIFSILIMPASWAQPRSNHIAADLVPERAAAPGETMELAISMRPESGWHGYWVNPGDAGFGMDLNWQLPQGVTTGEPRYPTPEPLLIGPLMNHVYEGPYAVLVPISIPADAVPGSHLPIRLSASWLACTDRICVPEQAELSAIVRVSDANTRATVDPRFAGWTQALPAPLVENGRYAIEGRDMRIAIPLAAGAALEEPHLFLAHDGIANYAAPQKFSRRGNWLIVSTEARADAATDGPLDMVLRLDRAGAGIAFTADPGEVTGSAGNSGGNPVSGAGFALIAAAFAGGLLLNIMPCVFPILSLKALHLARAGGDIGTARREALAYTAGVVLAVLALGGIMLALRAAGNEVGWAFQLQEPATVILLLALVVAIAANLAGMFEFTLPVRLEGNSSGSFMTGLLAAVAATPCTAPFMATAMGAALLLPPAQALSLFAALGLGLAFPFLAIGYVPLFRRLLPKPGHWMETFRRFMAIPMALTALALLWLCWRLGGAALLSGAVLLAGVILGICWMVRKRQRSGRSVLPAAIAASIIALGCAGAASALVPTSSDNPPEMAFPSAVAFNEVSLARARDENRPVFLYFTADWCVTCKVNETLVIGRAPVIAAFESAGVTVMVGDWTRRDPAITRFLANHGAAGVPLYLWYRPGSEPEQLPQVLNSEMLIDRARVSMDVGDR